MTSVTFSCILFACCLAICVDVTQQRHKPRMLNREIKRNRLNGSKYRHHDNTEQEIKCRPCAAMTMKACQVKYDLPTLTIV